MKNIYLYIHIPYCYRKCPYCSFISYDNKLSSKNAYVEALKKEIKNFADNYRYRVKTVYFGGGTPSLLNYKYIDEILDTIYKNFYVDKNIEITLESNPVDLSKKYLMNIKNIGINRLSIGIQSFLDKKLSILGRLHNAEQSHSCIQSAINLGFDNISIDLIYGVNETLEDTEYEVSTATSFGIKHISAYMLSIEKNTKFYEWVASKKIDLLSDEIVSQMYIKISEMLTQNGFRQYEISNFAKDGKISNHNMAYWLGHNYRGFGVSATSFIGNRRFKNTNSIDKYIKSINSNRHPVEYSEYLEQEARMREAFVLLLRTSNGVNIDSFNKKYHIDIEKYYSNELKSAFKNNLMHKKDGRIFLNGPKSMVISNYILSDFI